MGNAEPSTCLVSMPFIPITMPGLGISTLKAVMEREGLRAEVYYGALDYFRFFFTDDTLPAAPLLEYDFIAQNADVGDVFFAAALWRDLPDTFDRVREVLAAIRGAPNPIMSADQLALLMDNIEGYARRAADFVRHCYEARDWSRHDVVGFSSTFCQNAASLCLARMIRERHEGVRIVFGGANCEGEMGEQMMRSFPWIDAIIRGEADLALPAFVRRLADGGDVSEVPGILYREGDRILSGAPPSPVRDLTWLPKPNFRDYFEQLPAMFSRHEVRLTLPVETSRGCWWGEVNHCTFCGLNPTTMTYREKSSERAAEEIESLAAEYGISDICAVDNILSLRHIEEVMPALAGKGYSIFYETKSNLTEAEVYQLARAGVATIQPGIESLSTEILRLMKKGVTGAQNIALLKWCAIYGVSPTWFLLYRFPHERPEPYFHDIELIPRLVHLPPPKNPNPVIIDRYSPLFTNRDAIGLRGVRPSQRASVVYRGLDERERFAISYHFDADLPQGSALPYELPLWEAVLHWIYAAAREARFYQFTAPQTTLLVDTRRDDRRRAYLLTGLGHRVHEYLRVARRMDAIAAFTATSATAGPTIEDLLLAHVGGLIGADAIDAPAGRDDLPRFLGELDRRWITATLDGRCLALAIDCVDAAEARALGLAPFARRWEDLGARALAGNPRCSAAASADLIQLLGSPT